MGLSGDLEFCVSDRSENQLKKIHDQKLIGHQLLSAKERGEQVFVWRFVGDRKVMVSVKIDVVKKASLELIVRPAAEDDAGFLGILGGAEHLNFFLPSSSLLFQSSLKHVAPSGQVTVAFPSFVAQVERRKWLRLRCADRSDLRLQFSKPIPSPVPSKQFFAKPLQDLSAGGLSFLITRAEAKFFIAGEKIKNLEVIVKQEKLILVGQILRVQEPAATSPQKLLKVTVAFDSVQKKEQDFLSRFVFENLSLDEKAV